MTSGTQLRWIRPLFAAIAAFAAFASLSVSCGRELVRLTKEDRERFYRETYSATPENLSSWVRMWDGESWIVGLRDEDAPDSPDDGFWRGLVTNGLTDHFLTIPGAPFGGGAGAVDLFRDLLYRNLRLSFSNSPAPPGFSGLDPEDATQWFALVTLPRSNPLWQNIIGLPIPGGATPPSVLEKLAVQQFSGLRSIPAFAWVEPNLGADPQQQCGPCTEEELASSRPQEWCFQDGQPLEVCRNRVRQVYTRINWHKAQDYFLALKGSNPSIQEGEIVVAVVDTGIDYLHTDLKDRMYANPGEVNGQPGVDDDGNGFFDDIYGIDATRPQNTDNSWQAPGAADVGGPGEACPAGVEQPGGGSCGHGTHVAGIVAAAQGGSHAFGLCDKCKVYSIRASKTCIYPQTTTQGRCVEPTQDGKPPAGNAESGGGNSYIANGKIFDWDQIVGLNYLLNFMDEDRYLRVSIVNMSLGQYIYNRAMASSLTKLEQNGVLTIAAAGNDNTETPMFPAAYGSTLSVCATSEDPGVDLSGSSFTATRGAYAKASFSNFGDWVDLCAPGVAIQSTHPGNRVYSLSGTSQASPLVAAAAGFLWSILGSGENSRSIRARLEGFANPDLLYNAQNKMNLNYIYQIGNVRTYLLGTGLIDVEAALKGASGGATPSYADVDRSSGANSQLSSGCVVSAIGSGQAWYPQALTSMPFLLGQVLLALRVLRRWQRRMNRGES
jgi:subtilisin family serine protease